MKVFMLERERDRPCTNAVSIDPGIASTGICMLKPKFQGKDRVQVRGIVDKNTKVTKYALPALIQLVNRKVVEYMGILDSMGADYSDMEATIEYTFLGGQFSVGNCMIIQALTQELWVNRKVARVSYVPPRIPEFFYKTRSASNRMTLDMARSIYPDFPSKGIAVHAADAFLFSVYRHYKYYTDVLKLSLPRTPVYTIERIEYGSELCKVR